MKKLFKMVMAAGVMMSMPAGNGAFQAPQSRMMVIGSGKPNYAKMKVKELRKIASNMKIKGRSKAVRKADLIAIIEKAGK